MVKYIICLFLLLAGSETYAQHAKILKGVAEFRNIVLSTYMANFQHVEKIKKKLAGLGISDQEFVDFCSTLDYVGRNLYTGELMGREYMVANLKSSRSYKNLSKSELTVLIENMELIFVSEYGVWNRKYPHNLDLNSLRLKEIGEYGIEAGDRILHYAALKNRLGEILYLALDSIEIDINPNSFIPERNRLFDLIAGSGLNPTSSLKYSFDTYPKSPNHKLYDKIIFDCLGILFFREYPTFKKKIKTIHRLLEADGEFIVGANYQFPPFDGPFQDISKIDKKVERILQHGFEVKERIHVAEEYLIYKFRKVEK